jgi:outer membrane biosynthesis protein TonB
MTLAQSSTTIFSPSNLKLFLYGSIVVFMIVARIVKAAKEAAEKKRIEDAIKQAELEALRTGRPVQASMQTASMPEQSAAERLEELARQRSQQIQAARVRASKAPKHQNRVAATPTPQVRGPRPQQRPTPQPVKPAIVNPQRRKSTAEPLVETERGESSTHRLVPDAIPSAANAPVRDFIRPGTSRDDLRKALVLREVIDPPMCLRD